MITKTQADPLFSARLRPHNTLSPRGRRAVVLLIVALAAIPGIVFLMIGAWPVLGFMGLDVVLAWWALSHATRHGKRCEQITLWREQLEVLQTSPKGEQSKLQFSPASVRLLVTRDFEERTTSLSLRSDGREVEIGAFMHPADKASFAKEFGRALRKARR